MLYRRSRMTYFQEMLSEAKKNERGSVFIIIVAAFLVELNFLLPKYVSSYLGPAIVVMGVIIGLVGALELFYHHKEYTEIQALMEQLKKKT